ncbi:MAG: 50S ribosomal protein L16 [Chloroflexi bacterium]|nr:50S ribosomal protein L16 [Chloroflexota bacterium]
MQQPSRVKYRKMQSGHPGLAGQAGTGNKLSFGDFGLQALESAYITARQIEAARRAITHELRRGGDVWVRIFPDKPVSKKPQETRMGSGKAPVDHWVAIVKRGRMMFEVGGVSEEQAKSAMRLAAHKLPIDVKFVARSNGEIHEAKL